MGELLGVWLVKQQSQYAGNMNEQQIIAFTDCEVHADATVWWAWYTLTLVFSRLLWSRGGSCDDLPASYLLFLLCAFKRRDPKSKKKFWPCASKELGEVLWMSHSYDVIIALVFSWYAAFELDVVGVDKHVDTNSNKHLSTLNSPARLSESWDTLSVTKCTRKQKLVEQSPLGNP